ncbi:hypothetical protein [Bartonella machadoae]|uniref:hypothetical protein n=1 Tax=Bartonella machadoae TaxID=2893471 RepID=UPI001F4C9828|nr:hypothetical protein [Bartonella machadoae]UNE53951.1 hypothetical protein LNM86_10270 [Bartonella machadoae]
MRGDLIALVIMIALIVAIFAVFINMLIFALFYSVFKRERMNNQVKKELKRVLQENQTALVPPCRENSTADV